MREGNGVIDVKRKRDDCRRDVSKDTAAAQADHSAEHRDHKLLREFMIPPTVVTRYILAILGWEEELMDCSSRDALHEALGLVYGGIC